MTKAAMQRCRQCGCADDRACRLAYGDPCYWVLPDLCSNPRCLFVDPRTPPLGLSGSWFEPQRYSTAAGLLQHLLFRPLASDETVPDVIHGQRGRAAVPEPREEIRPLISGRVPARWLLRCAFVDPGTWAVEVHPRIRVSSAFERAIAQVGGLGLVRRRDRVFVVRREEWERRRRSDPAMEEAPGKGAGVGGGA